MIVLETLRSFIKKDDRPLLVPEVVQSSAMDCGPAALKSLLQGYRINVSYGRLREVCQTDVDGTSIGVLEDIAVQLGLNASQLLLPTDHLLLAEVGSLPALVVTRQPSGMTHFIIIWRIHGDWVQVMDPSVGRRWLSKSALHKQLYIHEHTIDVNEYYEWAKSPGFCEPLTARLSRLYGDEAQAEMMLEVALASGEWQDLATLDAATRLVQSLRNNTGAVNSGQIAADLVGELFRKPELIPASAWIVQPVADQPEQLVLQGVVIIHIDGLQVPSAGVGDASEAEALINIDIKRLRETLSEGPPEPERYIWGLLRKDGLLSPAFILAGIIMAALGVSLEILIIRGLVEITQQTHLASQRLDAFTLVILFMVSFMLLEWLLSVSVLRMGRRLEVRLRRRFLKKLPKLGDRFFSSRLSSDLVQRAHELQSLHHLPMLGMNFIRYIAQLTFVTVGLIIIYPQGFLLILTSTLIILATSWLIRPVMQEQDMRFRTHTGSLGRFYLDALKGLLPIRSHGAEEAIDTEHERNLVNWANAGTDFFVTSERVALLTILLESVITIWLVMSFMQSGGDGSGTLILVYWLMLLPQLGQSVMSTAQEYPSLRNRLLRILEPLNTPDENYRWYPDADKKAQPATDESPEAADSADKMVNSKQKNGISIHFDQAQLVLSGQLILDDLSARLSAGEHVAIVGTSGAGKSSLVGLLLGWYKPAGGAIYADGALLEGDHLRKLRTKTAWIDPDVQLWNRSLDENLNYGLDGEPEIPDDILVIADLVKVLEDLPEGGDTILGEGGSRLSGGEGQRVRLGRAMQQNPPSLVIMDEPFRGLTRGQRSALLQKARQYWHDSTLIFISHDVQDTLDFDRIWVVDKGRIVEDGHPTELIKRTGQYKTLLDTELETRTTIWESTDWSRLRMENGQLYGR